MKTIRIKFYGQEAVPHESHRLQDVVLGAAYIGTIPQIGDQVTNGYATVVVKGRTFHYKEDEILVLLNVGY